MSLFTDVMITYVNTPKLTLICEYKEVTGYKVTIQKSILRSHHTKNKQTTEF